MRSEHIFVDEWLVGILSAAGYVPDEDIAAARTAAVPFLSQHLTDGKKIIEEALLGLVQRTYGFSTHPSGNTLSEKPPINLLPERICRNYVVFPVNATADELHLLTPNPLAVEPLEDSRIISARHVKPVYALPSTVSDLIDAHFNRDTLIESLIDRLGETGSIEVFGVDAGPETTDEEALSGPVVDFVNSLILKAARLRASDIHIEHEERTSIVRCRVDGVMRELLRIPPALGKGPVVSRLKVMANLDLADHIRPKDGRLRILHSGRELSARLSFLPTQFGEDVVMRLVDRSSSKSSLEDLGLSPRSSALYERLSRRHQGITVFTGPTGSGKSTSAYAALNLVRTAENKTVTVEDPIEHRLSGVNQVQVNDKQGLGFSEALRAILRQDPDIILVGEMRDAKTAEVAFQAAVTGHLVFSTLHTNDAISTIVRLLGLGVEHFQIASGLSGVISQRLVRRLCDACKKPVEANTLPEGVRSNVRRLELSLTPFAAVGCEACAFSGFKGRIAIAEILEITPALGDIINERATVAELRAAAIKGDLLHSLLDDAVWQVASGFTTVEEASRHCALTAPSRPGAQEAASGGPRVLVVDDEDAVRKLTGGILSHASYSVETAPDGIQGLQALARDGADLVLLDLEMPRLDGIGFLRVLRQGLGNLSTKVVVLTSNDSKETRALCVESGCDDYLVKPADPLHLLERVRGVLER